MQDSANPRTLWSPAPGDLAGANATAFMGWLERHLGERHEDLDSLWEWSVRDLDGFWSAVWSYHDLRSSAPFGCALAAAEMPGAEWFPGAVVNYAEQALRWNGDGPALVAIDELGRRREIDWSELRAQVGACAATLRGCGVGPGDRVAGYLPNAPEAAIALLAAASIGAVWAVCGPDFGVQGAIARFAQLRPTVLVAVDGYRFGGKFYDRGAELDALIAALPSLRQTIVVDPRRPRAETIAWSEAIAEPAPLEFEQVPFDHPLWVLFSSGTTGDPKGIVHGHGGIVVEHVKSLSLGVDLSPGDRFLFYSSTTWMVWNYLLGALLVGATPVLYDGSPGHPDLLGVWRVAAASGADVLGTGSAYLAACARDAADPAAELDLSRVRTVIATGSPLPDAAALWLYDRLGSRVRLDVSSGGTDVCGSFASGSPLAPVILGEISRRCLGVRMEAWDEAGRSVVDRLGELVITAPMPSMPVSFWDDPDGSRYLDAYFSTYPGVWRHGDWVRLTSRGTVVIEGRSDTTLNRGGVRMGSADIYAVVEAVPGVLDSLVVGVERSGGEYEMPLFVVLEADRALDDETRDAIVAAIRVGLSPRHVPDTIVQAPAIPRTRTGKKMELPVKRLLASAGAIELNQDAAVDAAAVEWFRRYAGGA